MADFDDKKFEKWYQKRYVETGKGKPLDELNTSEKDSYEKEFKNLVTYLEKMEEKFPGCYDYNHYMETEPSAKDRYAAEANMFAGQPDEKRDEFMKASHKRLCANIGENTNTGSDDHHDNNWIKETEDSWKKWCVFYDKDKDEGHNPAYVYDRITEDVPDTELKFNVFLDEKKEKLGATIHYKTERDITLETEEGKVPGFEFFDKMIYDAKKKGVPAVNFVDAEHMTDDFKAKLAIACIKQNIPMEGFDGNVDHKMHLTEKEFKKLPAETQKEIEYRDIKNAVNLCKTKGDTVTVKISPKQKDKSTVAMLYAAAKEVGAKVEGFDAFTKDSHGMFILPGKDKEILPKEVRAAINKVNSDVKEKNIEDIRAKVKTNTDPGNASAIAKFNEFDDARNLMNLMMKTDAGKSLRANLDRENHDRDLALAGKPARFNVSVKDEDVIAFLESLKGKDNKFSEDTLETLFPDKKKRGEFLKNTKHPEEQAKLFKKRYIEASDVIRKDAKFIKKTKDHHSAYNMARNKLLEHSL